MESRENNKQTHTLAWIVLLSLVLHIILAIAIFCWYHPEFIAKIKLATVIIESERPPEQQKSTQPPTQIPERKPFVPEEKNNEEPNLEKFEYLPTILAQAPHISDTKIMTKGIVEPIHKIDAHEHLIYQQPDMIHETIQESILGDHKDEDQPAVLNEVPSIEEPPVRQNNNAQNTEQKTARTQRKKRKKRLIDLMPPALKAKTDSPSQQGASQNGIPTFTQIAQGFLQSPFVENGRHPVDGQDLELQVYANRVWSILRQSVNTSQQLVTLDRDIVVTAVLYVTINKQGTIIKAEFKYASKSPELAKIEFILDEGARTAGRYPPIPDDCKTDSVSLKFPISIRGHQGTHSYELCSQRL